MSTRNPKVDSLLNDAENWREERRALRDLLLDAALDEGVKWGKLCYMLGGKNVAMIYGLKDACAIGFFKGALMKDPNGILEKPGENSQAMRWAKVTSITAIKEKSATLKNYIEEAVTLEKSGAQIDFKEKGNLVLAEELQEKLASDAAFKAAFEKLTPGRQRGYNLHFSGAKQAKTRLARIEKYTPKILAGKGLQDR
jgi:uncharacterized protein YdeI (YjbR/CyaY-like superfamily)